MFGNLAQASSRGSIILSCLQSTRVHSTQLLPFLLLTLLNSLSIFLPVFTRRTRGHCIRLSSSYFIHVLCLTASGHKLSSTKAWTKVNELLYAANFFLMLFPNYIPQQNHQWEPNVKLRLVSWFQEDFTLWFPVSFYLNNICVLYSKILDNLIYVNKRNFNHEATSVASLKG